jgi:ATP-dependent helicase/nuclease subunit A
LLTLAGAILARVEAEKSRRGALDFDDLISRTRQLLARADAAWVLYKLDAGIDHVLVDEAQDTNPAQWEILRALTADFTAGAGARGARRRTIFAVGDPKQSIYGFQGAEPREFEASGRHFRRHIEAAAQAFEDVPLRVSFRSAPAILAAVDAVFAVPDHFSGLSFDLDDASAIGTIHQSHRHAAHGRLELWPVVCATDSGAGRVAAGG